MNLYEKLIEVRKAVPYLQKENSGFQYKFVSSSQALAAVRGRMDELGVLLVPRVVRSGFEHKQSENDKGKVTAQFFTWLDMEFTWINAEKPEETITCPWYAQGIDTGEKGVGKAMTYGEKYFILKFFNIATDKDDPDQFQRRIEDSQPESKAEAKAAKSAAEAKAAKPAGPQPPAGWSEEATVQEVLKLSAHDVQEIATIREQYRADAATKPWLWSIKIQRAFIDAKTAAEARKKALAKAEKPASEPPASDPLAMYNQLHQEIKQLGFQGDEAEILKQNKVAGQYPSRWPAETLNRINHQLADLIASANERKAA